MASLPQQSPNFNLNFTFPLLILLLTVILPAFASPTASGATASSNDPLINNKSLSTTQQDSINSIIASSPSDDDDEAKGSALSSCEDNTGGGGDEDEANETNDNDKDELTAEETAEEDEEEVDLDNPESSPETAIDKDKNNKNSTVAVDKKDIGAILEPSATSLDSTSVAVDENLSNSAKREVEVLSAAAANDDAVVVDKNADNDNDDDKNVGNEEEENDEDNFCQDNYVDSAYFNGYDTILTRGDRLWYYYKEQHKISKAYDQRRFTQGDHIQGAFNISRTPRCGHHQLQSTSLLNTTTNSLSSLSSSSSPPSSTNPSPLPPVQSSNSVGDCKEISKLQAMAVYFLHNKDRSRSYYNLDVRNVNGSQKRVRSRDLPWGMKQVGLLGGNLWPNGWESYQAFRPVAFLPSRLELIFIINHFHHSAGHQEEGADSQSQDEFGGVDGGVNGVNGTVPADHHHHGKSPDHSSLISNSTPHPHHPPHHPHHHPHPHHHRYTALLTWNSLDTSSWNSSWRSRVLTHAHPTVYTGMFEMNGIVYAIGESRVASSKRGGGGGGKASKRIGKMYRYYVTEDDGRDLRETDQSVGDFFGCPRRRKNVANQGGAASVSSILPVNQQSIDKKASTTKTNLASSATSTTTAKPSSAKGGKEDNHNSSNNNNNRKQSKTIDEANRLKTSANVFLQSAPAAAAAVDVNSPGPSSSSVFLRNSKAKILPITITPTNTSAAHISSHPQHRHHHHLLTPLLPATEIGKTTAAGGVLPPGVAGLRESDSILLTIFIGIVISACVATIVLAFLTITGRKKDHLPPRFEGARIERTIPKPTIIGLDYHPRKSSFASASSLTAINQLMTRYDSLNSINAIYSSIGTKQPANGGTAVNHFLGTNHYAPAQHHHHQQQIQQHQHQQQQQQHIAKGKSKKSKHSAKHSNGQYSTVDRLNSTFAGGSAGVLPPPVPPPVPVTANTNINNTSSAKSNVSSSAHFQSQSSPSTTNHHHHPDASFSGQLLNGSSATFQNFDAHFE